MTDQSTKNDTLLGNPSPSYLEFSEKNFTKEATMAPRTIEEDNGSFHRAEKGEGAPNEQTPLVGGDGEPGKSVDGSSFGKSKIGIILVVCILCGIIFVLSGVFHPSHFVGPYRIDWDGKIPPLSMGAPEEDLGLQGIHREMDASPSSIWGKKGKDGPLPTNSWYLNLVSHRAKKPDAATRVYTVPYIIDTAPANNIAGLRVHWPVIQTSSYNVQMVNDFKNGISLGTLDPDVPSAYQVDQELDLSMLGVSLRWSNDTENGGKSMLTHLVRGMPYATMKYDGGVLPTLFSYNGPSSKPVIDGSTELSCGVLADRTVDESGPTVTVEKELKLHFINSDFTWIVLFSQPVDVQCGVTEGDEQIAEFQLNVKSISSLADPLTVRLALIDQCTTGESNIKAHCAEKQALADRSGYIKTLRNSSHIIATNPRVEFDYPNVDGDANDHNAYITFDWAAENYKNEMNNSDVDDLIMFALPHHQKELLDGSSGAEITPYCIPTFHGKTCLVKGSKWSLAEDLSRPQSFTARRPPQASIIPELAKAVSKDIKYRLSDNMMRGAADTYFSGKILSKAARTIVIADELRSLADGGSSSILYDDDEGLEESMREAARASGIPSKKVIQQAVSHLKKGVQIWLDEPEATYVYDKSWGGMVNCGCRYTTSDSHGICNNTFPDCPALASVNEDFGNGYYNDHHFHYGYHVYAAAVVAKFDHDWAKLYFDKVLLYIRDYANPSEHDYYFTQFRQKDWWLGSSWASGIVSAENSPHGRDQESSSEAIAAYESMALYGQVMAEILENESNQKELEAARLVRDAGELLTITEVAAANRYWHVWSSDTHNNTYPAGYTQPVVGMLYDTMASFQTWFSPLPVVSYGIQLMPFTPVAEIRDDPEWASLLYPIYKESCEAAAEFCIENGWSIIQAGLLATTGNREEAVKQALKVPEKVFSTDGGVGNSLSNTIWYIATRKSYDNATNSTR